jgi:hypothetical protein
MGASLRKKRTALHRINALVILTMVLMPVGMPMPAVPGADSVQAATPISVLFTLVNPFSALTEDDLEVEHHDFTIVRLPCAAEPVDGSNQLISFLWTERLHRPPIS